VSKRLFTSVAALMVAGGILTGQLVASGAEFQGGPDCSEDDLILEMSAIIGSNGDGSASGRDALGQFIRANYPKLQSADFTSKTPDSDEEHFSYVEDGKEKATAIAERLSGGWYLTGLAACNSTLVKAGGGQ